MSESALRPREQAAVSGASAPGPALLETVCDLERVAIVFNPASGTEDRATRQSSLEELARAAGLTCPLAETDVDRGAGPLVEQAVADGMERIIVSGGDGSMTQAAHVLVGTQVSLAVVPGGTGNLLALNLGIPTDRADAMRLALSEKAKPTDIGRANGAVFLIGAGMGLDARVMRDADPELKDRYGKLAYVVSAVRNFGRRHTRYAVTVDGVRYLRDAQTVMIANLGLITGGLELVPGSDPDDGLLDVAVLRTRRLQDLVLLALRASVGRARSDSLLEIHQGRHIVVETSRPQPVQIDGDEVPPATRLEAMVEPGALLLVRPEERPPANALSNLARSSHVPRSVVALGGVGLAGALLWWIDRRRR